MRSIEIAEGIDALASEDVYAVPASSLADEVVRLHRQLARLQGEMTRRVAALDHLTAGQIDGHVSTASWLRDACSTTHAYASDLVRTSRVLDARPVCAAALHTGAMSYAHARVVASALFDVPADSRDSAEPILLEAAVKLDPGRLRSVATRLRETINRDHADRSAARDHARRRLHVSRTLDGMVVLDGLLDPEAGGVVLSALMPLSRPLGPDDTRTPAQRRADALVEIADHTLRTGELPVVGGHRPAINVTLSLESLRKEPGTPSGELDWGGDVTAEIARRLSCDAAVRRIVLGPDSRPLDVGRTKRVVTPAQRAALAARDRGCTWPGCTRPHWWTDAHHIVS
ncbi:MAG: DUF222 domain-containing protein, partial [Pseudonocardiaceae bacterium]